VLSELDSELPCGPARAAILNAVLGGDGTDLATARERVAADGSGRSSVEDVLAGLRRYGLYAEAVTLDRGGVPMPVEVGPVIAHQRHGHFVVARATRNRSVVVTDRYGSGVQPVEEFLSSWSGHLIIARRTEADLFKALAALGVKPAGRG
jgi:ABC-type bacteriocin/lantibiotic exporter with double-glycine peptidase domain